MKFIKLFAIIFIGCGSNKTEKISNPIAIDSPEKKIVFSTDSLEFTESFNQEDEIVNDYLIKELEPIRENFKRINSIENWTTIDSAEIFETTEGGEIRYYFLGDRLEKLSVRNFGETFQQISEYYLLAGHLSFVRERTYKYNRPIFYDSLSMKENNDTEVFDLKKSRLIENRSYFSEGKLFHQINNEDCGTPFSDEFLLKENKRLLTSYEYLCKERKNQ